MSLVVGENTPFVERRGEFMAAARLEYLQDESGIYGISIPTLTYNGPRALPRTTFTSKMDGCILTIKRFRHSQEFVPR